MRPCRSSDGSRNASSQYRAYDRMASRSSSSNSWSGMSGPTTTRRFSASWRAPAPRRRYARSATARNAAAATGSGIIRINRHAAPNAQSTDRSLALTRPRSRCVVYLRRFLRRLDRLWRPILAIGGSEPLPDRQHRQYGEDDENDVQAVRDPGRRQQTADADQDQPLGSLDEADVRIEAEALGACLHVRHDLAGHEAHQRGRGTPVPTVGGEVVGDRAEYRAVGDPVARRVEERSELARAATSTGHGTVDQVGERAERDDDRAGEIVAGHREQGGAS